MYYWTCSLLSSNRAPGLLIIIVPCALITYMYSSHPGITPGIGSVPCGPMKVCSQVLNPKRIRIMISYLPIVCNIFVPLFSYHLHISDHFFTKLFRFLFLVPVFPFRPAPLTSQMWTINTPPPPPPRNHSMCCDCIRNRPRILNILYTAVWRLVTNTYAVQ